VFEDAVRHFEEEKAGWITWEDFVMAVGVRGAGVVWGCGRGFEDTRVTKEMRVTKRVRRDIWIRLSSGGLRNRMAGNGGEEGVKIRLRLHPV
jgi:hypothetical protein